MNAGGTINATVTVTNTGKVEGTEVVQFYIRDMVGSIARPVQELKGFERISLKPGESRTVTFTINADLLKFYNKELEYVCEPGQFEAMIGPNSRDVQRLTFTLR
jgi:beta-glucosidase